MAENGGVRRDEGIGPAYREPQTPPRANASRGEARSVVDVIREVYDNPGRGNMRDRIASGEVETVVPGSQQPQPPQPQPPAVVSVSVARPAVPAWVVIAALALGGYLLVRWARSARDDD